MGMSLTEVRHSERDALLGEYLIPTGGVSDIMHVPPYVAISSIFDLVSTPSGLRGKYPLSIESFPNGGGSERL